MAIEIWAAYFAIAAVCGHNSVVGKRTEQVGVRSAIQAGDIILVTDKNVLVAFPIRAVAWTSSLRRGWRAPSLRWSHALIAISPLSLAEAVPGLLEGATIGKPIGRVQAIDSRRLRVGNRCDICVLRLTGPDAEHAARAAANAAARAISLRYNLTGVLGFLLPFLNAQSVERRFCSELICEAYRTAGIELLPGRDSHRVTPAELASSALLADVTAESVAPWSPFGHRRRDPGGLEQARIATMQAVREDPAVAERWAELGEVGALIDPVEAVLQTRDGELDRLIADILRTRRYDLAADDYDVAPWLPIFMKWIQVDPDPAAPELNLFAEACRSDLERNEAAGARARVRLADLNSLSEDITFETIALDKARWMGMLRKHEERIDDDVAALQLVSHFRSELNGGDGR